MQGGGFRIGAGHAVFKLEHSGAFFVFVALGFGQDGGRVH
jgi:hypothetical protein